MLQLSKLAYIGLALFEVGARVEAQTQISPPAPAAIDALFKDFDTKESSGCSVAVVEAGEVVFKKSYGMADPALGVPMTSRTTNWIPYSETRIFVGLAIAMLSREGQITLDDPVRDHVSQVPEYAKGVTIRHLLHHSSGLADYGALAGPGYDLGDRLPEDEFFRMISRWGVLASEPGRTEEYSNTDYALLKILVERVSGKSLHNYLAERIFKPLGMNSTRVGFAQETVTPNHALFYDSTPEGLQKVLRYRVSPVGGISITTSLDDLIRWDQALRDGELGIPALIEELKQGALAPANANGSKDFLFGIYHKTFRGVPMVEFRGVGEFIYLVQVPDKKLSVATLCNNYNKMWELGPNVAALYAGAAPDETAVEVRSAEPKPMPIVPPPITPLAVPESQLRMLVGDYGTGNNPLNVVGVTVAEGRLIVTPRGRPSFPPLKALGNNIFETSYGASRVLIAFKQEGENMILSTWDATANEPGADDIRRISSWTPSQDNLRSYSGVYVGDKVDITLYVQAEGDNLMIAGSGLEAAKMTPQAKTDEFRLPAIYWARFERSADGNVSGMILDAVRVKGIRFTRQ